MDTGKEKRGLKRPKNSKPNIFQISFSLYTHAVRLARGGMALLDVYVRPGYSICKSIRRECVEKTAIFVLLSLFIFCLTLSADATDVKWNGGGADNFASNPANWAGGAVPHDDDAIIFDSTSIKDCTWDIYRLPASLSLNSGYTGTVTLNAELVITGSANVSDGKLVLEKTLSIGVGGATVPPSAPSALIAAAVSSSQIHLSWTDNSHYETGFKIERKEGVSGTYIQIDTVGANTTAYSDTGLTTGTTYYYRVRAYNSSGDSAYSNEAAATPSSSSIITLTITSPSNGATINGPNVMVKGSVANSGGYETGVTVNGVVANTYGNQFTANRVPLEEGTNIITATATDTHGHTATVSITINAVTTGNYIRLTADTESGIAPLEATLSIDGSFSITNSSVTVTGPAQPEFLSSSADEYKVRMTVEGIYYYTAIVTGPDANQYQDTIAITVMNQTQLDNLLKGIWDEMKTALLSQDINSALTYFISDSRQLYNDIFTALSAQLPQLVQDMQDIQLIYVENNSAKYRIRRTELCGGQMSTITYYIYFAVDENGTWKIYKF